MKQYFFICTMLLAAACSREKVIVTEEILDQEVVENQPKVTYIVAKGGETKAGIANDGAFTWNAKDKIAVYAGGYKISEELDGSYDNTNGAVFEFTGGEAFDEEDRANFAVFPSGLVYDGNGDLYTTDVTASSLKVNLPGTYTLAQVAGGVTPVPMIATNEQNGNLAFKNICALLRITVNNISKDAHTLKITFPGKKVQGEFTLTSVVPGTTATVTADTAGEDDTIIITDLGISSFTSDLVISLPVPTGEYGDVVVGAYDSDGHRIHYIYKPIKSSANWNPGRTTARKVTVNLPVFTSNAVTGKKIVFAPGNLRGTIKTKPTSDAPLGSAKEGKWRFADNQYDALGNSSGNTFSETDVELDLFAWIGSGASSEFNNENKYGLVFPLSTSQTDANAVYVGKDKTDGLKFNWADLLNGVSYPAGTWRLPTSKGSDEYTEWERLTTYRTTSNGYVSAKATILEADGETVVSRGLIIFPDTFVLPNGFSTMTNEGLLVEYQRDEATSSDAHYADNKMTKSMWELLEKKGGCAFLPVTSLRYRSGGANVEKSIGDAAYWTDYSGNTQKAYALVVSDADLGEKSATGSLTTALNCQKDIHRTCGCAVRLVRDVN